MDAGNHCVRRIPQASSKHHQAWVRVRGWVIAHRVDLACVLCVLLVSTGFLAPALRPGYTLLPLQWVSRLLPWSEDIDSPLRNTTLGDPFFAFYPRRQFFTETIRAGDLPFWNPYMLGGYPAVGDTNAQTFYPFNWLAALYLSPARSFSILAWFHLSLTGLLMFGMLRSHKLRSSSSLLGSVSWMLSGILVVWLEHPHRLSSFAWLPGLFWAFHVGNRRRKPAFSVLAGLAMALMILGGQPQYAAIGGVLLGLYALTSSLDKDKGGWNWDRWPLVSLGITAAIGLGLGAIQLLPTYEFTLQSHREPRPMHFWLWSALPLRHLSTFWLPDLFGSPEVGKYPYWGKLNYVEYTFYFGVFPCLLSMLAPALNRKNKIAWLWSGILVLTALVAVGSPLAHLARLVPGMTYFSLHRMMSHTPFLGSWLAALGFDALTRREDFRHAPWLGASAAVLILCTGIVLHACRLEVRHHWDGITPELLRQASLLVVGLFGAFLMVKRPRVGSALILLVVTTDLFLWGRTFNPVSSLDLLYPHNQVTDWLKEDEGLFRVLPLRNDERVFGENVLSVFHIGTPDGYLALTLRHYKEMMYAIAPYFDDEARRFEGPHINIIVARSFRPQHSLLNVKYILSSAPLQDPQLHRACVCQGVYVYENVAVLPRAYVVHQAEPLSRDATLERLGSSDWDFHENILVPEGLDLDQMQVLDGGDTPDPTPVSIDEHRPNRVRLTASLERAGFLVLADPFCLGWQASINGQPVDIIRANHGLRAIFLEPGHHHIEFAFRPRSVVLGVVVAAASVIFGLIVLERGRTVEWAALEAGGPRTKPADRIQ